MSDEDTVFASAKPVSPADLVEGETETKPETKTSKPETRAKAETRTTGVPPWHLSAALGVTIVLVGGVILWLQSPLLAVIAVGGLAILVGLGLALRHFFQSETAQRHRATRSQGGTTGPSQSRSQSPGSPQFRSRRAAQDRQSETGPTKRWPWSRQRSRDRETNGQQPSRRRSRRSQPTEPGETASRTRSRRWSQDRSQAPAGPRGNGNRTRGVRTPQTLVNPGNQGPRPNRERRMIAGTSGPRVPDNWPPRPLTGKIPDTSKPDAIDPPKTKTKKKGDKKDTPTVAPETRSRPEDSVKTASKTPDIAWPNVDLDHYKPIRAHNLPRITVVRKAKRLPPIYHRMGEPQWPTSDPDKVLPIPDQRKRSSNVTTVDMLPKAARDAYLDTAAARALASAQERTLQAHEFRDLAQQTEGMDDLRADHEQHLLNTAKAARDAEVREEVAKIIQDYRQRH